MKLLTTICLLLQVSGIWVSSVEERLQMDLFRGYNSLISPAKNASEIIVVKISLQLNLLINVDERNQVLHTNVWLTLMWHDFQMKWNPNVYGGIETIRVAPDRVCADGNYEVSFMANVVISHKGEMLWVPPAIYKSSCIIEFFPFDEQNCQLIFGSWTYGEQEMKLDFVENTDMVDLKYFYASSIWDIVEAPAQLVKQKSRMEFQIRMRRKPLFYTVVLIIPTAIMAFLSVSVFFMPTDSTEKITLTISVLLSVVVFLLLVSKILPPTASTIPLMAKYLLLTFVLNVITIATTILIINVYFRSPTTHTMPQWIRTLFPFLMCIQRPPPLRKTLLDVKRRSSTATLPLKTLIHHPHCPSSQESIELDSPFIPMSTEALRALRSMEYITEHLRREEELKAYREDWKFVAMIIDRLMLYAYFGITLGGTCGILFSAPHVFEDIDQQAIIDQLYAHSKN